MMQTLKKTTILFFVFGFMALLESRAQTVVMEIDRATDSLRPDRGPNLKKFSHGFVYFGFVAGTDKPGSRIIYGTSVEFGGGARKKYKLSSLFSMGWELGANEQIFKLKQEEEKILPDTILNDVERMMFTTTFAAFYTRFNIDTHRGNFMGTFLDLGARGEWDIEITHTTKNTLPDGSNIKSQITNLPYVNNFNYNVFTRIGYSHGSLYVAYRLSKLFKTKYQYPELPALTAGIELAIFRQ